MAVSKARTPDVDDIDAGWEDEDDELDSGWDDPESVAEPEPPGELEERASMALTPEEREERVARAAERKERQRAKVAEKADRRKARVATAKSKQKKSAPKLAGALPPRVVAKVPERREQHDSAHVRVGELPEPHPVNDSPSAPRRDWRLIALLVALVVVACGVALYAFAR